MSPITKPVGRYGNLPTPDELALRIYISAKDITAMFGISMWLARHYMDKFEAMGAPMLRKKKCVRIHKKTFIKMMETEKE